MISMHEYRHSIPNTNSVVTNDSPSPPTQYWVQGYWVQGCNSYINCVLAVVTLEHWKRSGNIHFGDIDISAFAPPTDMKLAPKCLFSGILQYDTEFLFKRGYRKNLKIKIYPPCFEKVLFRKISLRGLQWCILSLAYPLWCWRNKHLIIFWQEPHLNNYSFQYIR